jgi:outer membrane lipoprotein-sorting protein
MKRNTLLIVFSLALILVGSAWAQTAKHSSNAAKDMKMSGAVVSSSSSELVLSSTIKGKKEQETFVVNPQTKTRGTLAAGDRAVVRYKNENGQKVATIITVQKTVAAKHK